MMIHNMCGIILEIAMRPNVKYNDMRYILQLLQTIHHSLQVFPLPFLLGKNLTGQLDIKIIVS